jgi:hypothetical protein
VDPDRAMNPVRFSIVPGRWAIARLSPDVPVPMWAFAADGFVSITRTADELSVDARLCWPRVDPVNSDLFRILAA